MCIYHVSLKDDQNYEYDDDIGDNFYAYDDNAPLKPNENLRL